METTEAATNCQRSGPGIVQVGTEASRKDSTRHNARYRNEGVRRQRRSRRRWKHQQAQRTAQQKKSIGQQQSGSGGPGALTAARSRTRIRTCRSARPSSGWSLGRWRAAPCRRQPCR